MGGGLKETGSRSFLIAFRNETICTAAGAGIVFMFIVVIHTFLSFAGSRVIVSAKAE
jgi:hypothetical protein